MNAVDIMDYFSSTLYFTIKNDSIYVVDTYHLGDPEYNYGIFDKLSVEDIKSGNLTTDFIPDIYIEGSFYELSDEIEGEFKDLIKKLSKCTYCNIDIEFERNISKITKHMEDLKDICRIMRGEEKIEGMTDEEIEKCCYQDAFAFECIEKCDFEYDEKDEI